MKSIFGGDFNATQNERKYVGIKNAEFTLSYIPYNLTIKLMGKSIFLCKRNSKEFMRTSKVNTFYRTTSRRALDFFISLDCSSQKQ